MKGYSKFKGSNSFIQRSKSNKEFLFNDRDFDLLPAKKSHFVDDDEEEETRFNDENYSNKNKKNDFLSGKTEEYEGVDERKGRALKRNFSVSSSVAATSYQKNIKGNDNNDNGGGGGNLERQSSTRAIQEVVKKVFSIRRSTSVNSDRYCRIYDQPIMSVDDDYYNNHDYHNDDDDNVNGNGNGNYKYERSNGSLERRSGGMMKKNHDHNGRKHVGSKVVKACKRLFSR